MSSTNKTTYYNLSQYVGTDKPTYLGDYNSDMAAIDTAIHEAADDASIAVSTANTANATASTASSNATSALSTANTALNTANTASETAGTASTNASAALTAASAAETAAAANTITNLAPAYDPTLTYAVDDLVTYIDVLGSGKLYKCIVAVSTPEAFNINKWDDVTTSEIYQKKSDEEIIYTTTANVSTYSDILNAISNAIDIDRLNNYSYIRIGTNYYKFSAADPTNLRYTFESCVGSGGEIDIRIIRISKNDTSLNLLNQTTITSSNVTLIERSSDILTLEFTVAISY